MKEKEKEVHEAKIAKVAAEPQDLPKAKSPGRAKAKSPGRAKAKSPGRAAKAKSPGGATKEQEKPKVKSPVRRKPTTKPKGKSPGRSTTGSKTPKVKEKPTDDVMNRKVAETSKKTKTKDTKTGDDVNNRKVTETAKKTKTKDTETGDDANSRKVAKKSKTTKGPQPVDDENFDLNLDTGKFVQKKKRPVKVVREIDDDIEMEIEDYDDEDRDQDYDPDKDPDQGDDDDGQMEEEEEADDDDFPIPPLRTKKSAKKPSDKSSSKGKKQKTSGDALADLADFMETTFKKPIRQITRKGRTEKKEDACINPVEAAIFRKAMQAEALEIEKAVQKGVNVREAYEALITHVIEACKDMNYEVPTDIDVADILPTIEDPTCKAWQLKLQGIQTAGEGELNVSKGDNAGVCVAKKKYEIKDIAAYMEEITADWSELKRKNFSLAMKKVMGNMSVAHRMVSEASQEMITLLDEIELPLWMKLADMTMRPLVLLEIPEVAVMCEEAQQISKGNQQNWNQSTKITTIMKVKNLLFLPMAWGYRVEDRAKKVITGIIYKYIKDQMYQGKISMPAMEVSAKYGLNATTMNRHILGKKYEGGKASGSGTQRPVAVNVTATERSVDKLNKKTSQEQEKQSTRTSKEKVLGKAQVSHGLHRKYILKAPPTNRKRSQRNAKQKRRHWMRKMMTGRLQQKLWRLNLQVEASSFIIRSTQQQTPPSDSSEKKENPLSRATCMTSRVHDGVVPELCRCIHV